jgi:RNA polymerase sigma-70 factor (ECF subfamily)
MLTEADSADEARPESVQTLPLDGDDYTHCVQMVEGIQAGRAESMEELYRILLGHPRYFLIATIPVQDVEDRIHETFQLVVSAIQRGQLRDPERLMGFVRTVLRRQAMVQICQLAVGRRIHNLDEALDVASTVNPEEAASSQEHLKIAGSILEQLPELQRTVLIEFYVNEKPAHQICVELNLTDTQFRLLKWRAKKKFGDLGRHRLRQGR